MTVTLEVDAARQLFTTKAVDRVRAANRSHKLALFTSIIALSISTGSIWFSWVSYQNAIRSLPGNGGAPERLQSAFLESEIKVDRSLADFGLPFGNDKPVKILFSLTLRNAGNTAGTRVQLKWIESLNDASNSPIRPTDEHNQPLIDLGVREEENIPLVVEMSSKEFRMFRHGAARLKIAGEVRYEDILSHAHVLNWTAVLNGDSVLIVS